MPTDPHEELEVPADAPTQPAWTEAGISEWGTSVFLAPVGTPLLPLPESKLYVPPAWADRGDQ